MGFLVLLVSLAVLALGLLVWRLHRQGQVAHLRDQARLRVIEGQLAALRATLRLQVVEHAARQRMRAEGH